MAQQLLSFMTLHALQEFTELPFFFKQCLKLKIYTFAVPRYSLVMSIEVKKSSSLEA